MHFIKSFATVLAVAAGVVAAMPLSTMAKRNAGAVCTDPNFENVTFVGNSSGTPFCESQWGTTYLPINTLTTWSDTSFVYAIQAIYSDGSQSPVHGNNTLAGLTMMSISVNYANASNDAFTTLNLYKASFLPYIDALYVVTKDGSSMNSGESIFWGPPSFPQNVGAGVLYGFSGTIDPDNGYLNSLGFQFLDSSITSIDVYNFTFGNLPQNDEDILPKQVGTAHYYNNQSSGSEGWTFANSYSHAVTFTFTQQYTETIGGMETVTVGYNGMMPVPVMVSSATEFSWQLQASQMFTNTYTNTTMVSWSETGSIGSHEGVTCVATIGIGSGSFPYNSTVTTNLKNGKSFTFEQSGTLSLTDVTDVAVLCSDDDQPGS